MERGKLITAERHKTPDNMEKYLTIPVTARSFGISELKIWMIIRAKKAKTQPNELGQVSVNLNDVSQYFSDNPSKLSSWKTQTDESAERERRRLVEEENYNKKIHTLAS